MGEPLVKADTAGWVRNQIQQKLGVLTSEELGIVNRQIANDRLIKEHERNIESLRLANNKLAEELNEKRGEIGAYRKELNRQFSSGL